MELRELETFRAVVNAGGMGRAAARLHRAQSSVTARIHQLEASLDVQLFERDGRRLRLTSAGERLLDYADRLLALAEETRAEVRRDRICGRLRLGAMEFVAASRLPWPLAKFHRQHRDVAVELQTAPSRELLARLQGDDIDAAIVSEEVDNERFLRVPLFVEQSVLIGAANERLSINPSDLNDRTMLILYGHGCAYRRRLDQWLQSQRIVPARTLEFGSYHAILAAAAAGVGWSMFPRSLLETYPYRDTLSACDVPSHAGEIEISLVMHRGRHLPALTRLAASLREQFEVPNPDEERAQAAAS